MIEFEGGSPWDVLEGEAVFLEARLHEGVGDPLPELPEDVGERLADALGWGDLPAAGEVVLRLRQGLRLRRLPGHTGLRGEGTRQERRAVIVAIPPSAATMDENTLDAALSAPCLSSQWSLFAQGG